MKIKKQSQILLFLLDVAIIYLGVVLKLIIQDDFLLFLFVFYTWVIKNAFVSQMHLYLNYITILVAVCIVYVFVGTTNIDAPFITIIQLSCSSFISTYVNKICDDEIKYIERTYMPKAFKSRRSSKDFK